ncbi:MAG: VanW family protein, partial [Patescibacteria group bacterium]|nr:VanW family protein [Patescibacteria group bacterium]
SYSFAYGQKIYPNVLISGINMGGLKPEEAKAKLEAKIQQVKDEKIVFSSDKINKNISPQDLQIAYQSDISVNRAYKIGREGNFWQQSLRKLAQIFSKTNLLAAFQLDRSRYNNVISEFGEKIDLASQDASCQLDNNQVKIIPERQGQKLDIDQLENNFNDTVGGLKAQREIKLVVVSLYPEINANQAELAKKKFELVLAQPIVFLANDIKIKLEKKDLIDWLEFVAKSEAGGKKILDIALNEVKIKKYSEYLASKTDQQAQDAKLTISGGRATVWQKSQTGFSLKKDETVKLIADTILASSQVAGINSEKTDFQEVALKLPIDTTNPAISEDQINNLGIKELIASGTTNFKGSPANRIYNIKLGTELFNGAIIKPGEEFSTMGQLGSVSEARGFKKELVIKEDRTVPEVGGGLCQVSTTLFRAALNAGLEITERSNHKYRVSYYEPPVGLDATIYDPSPDLKFINNTSGYILIQSSVSGSKITFDFYGTKDGREVYISDPELYEYVNPPEPQYIDDPSLAPGEEKYKEKAHQGAKAKVNYVVKRDGKEINKQTFYSKYVAWGAIILRGPGEAPKEENPQPQPTQSESAQPSSSPSQTPTSSASPSAT